MLFFLLLMFHFSYYKNTNLYKHFKVAKQVWRELPNAWKQRFSTPLHFTVELHWVEPGSHEKHFRLLSVWSAGTEIGMKIFFKNRKHYSDSDLTIQVKKMAGFRHYYLACVFLSYRNSIFTCQAKCLSCSCLCCSIQQMQLHSKYPGLLNMSESLRQDTRSLVHNPWWFVVP